MKRLLAIARDLMRRHREYHELEPLMILYAGVFGAVTFPLLYLLRFTKSTPVYDDFAIRVVGVAACLLLIARKHWPQKVRPYFYTFSWWALIYTLPFTFVYVGLKNGGGTVAVANTLMVAFFVILMTDWRNMLAMLSIGFASAIGLYVFTDPAPRMPADYVARLPTLLLVIVGGSLFKLAVESATSRRVRDAYASLAGSIAHEMRNPLAQVRHSLEQIRAALPMPSVRVHEHVIDARGTDQLYRHVSQGEMAVQRGLQVITMTLDEVSAKAIDPGSLGYLPAAETCAKAIDEFGYENEQQRARVSLAVTRDFVFRGDETAYLFVLFNLLKNALYYLPAYPDATVRLLVDAGTITVRDTGPGMSPELASKLFQPFATRDKESGTGLGLAYCRRVTETFGGTIVCRSVPGSYTDFVMTFPVVQEEELQARRDQALADARRQLADRRVLLVEDDAILRAATRQKLLPLCCTVREAADGVEALQALREQAFDIVLLDLNMPRMDGYEVAESVRRGLAPLNTDVCLVAHTSEPPHLARVKTANAGFDDFLSKPADGVALATAMCEAIAARAARLARPKQIFAGRRFLVADDSAYNRNAVSGLLRHDGGEVVEAADGRAALEVLAQGRAFDAVLVDIQMPGMDGVETARRIRSGAAGESHVPILAITAHASPDVIASAGAAGIGDFILKPVDPAQLTAKLAALLGLRETAAATPRPQEDAPMPDALLDEQRLGNYRRIGMLHELVDDYVPQVEALMSRLLAAHAKADLPEATRTLHTMVGMTGEIGARVLYRYCRELYVGMLENRQWPADVAWPQKIRDLTQRSNRALVDWRASHDASATE